MNSGRDLFWHFCLVIALGVMILVAIASTSVSDCEKRGGVLVSSYWLDVWPECVEKK
jgi:hypothetical protein